MKSFKKLSKLDELSTTSVSSTVKNRGRVEYSELKSINVVVAMTKIGKTYCFQFKIKYSVDNVNIYEVESVHSFDECSKYVCMFKHTKSIKIQSFKEVYKRFLVFKWRNHEKEAEQYNFYFQKIAEHILLRNRKGETLSDNEILILSSFFQIPDITNKSNHMKLNIMSFSGVLEKKTQEISCSIIKIMGFGKKKEYVKEKSEFDDKLQIGLEDTENSMIKRGNITIFIGKKKFLDFVIDHGEYSMFFNEIDKTTCNFFLKKKGGLKSESYVHSIVDSNDVQLYKDFLRSNLFVENFTSNEINNFEHNGKRGANLGNRRDVFTNYFFDNILSKKFKQVKDFEYTPFTRVTRKGDDFFVANAFLDENDVKQIFVGLLDETNFIDEVDENCLEDDFFTVFVFFKFMEKKKRFISNFKNQKKIEDIFTKIEEKMRVLEFHQLPLKFWGEEHVKNWLSTIYVDYFDERNSENLFSLFKEKGFSVNGNDICKYDNVNPEDKIELILESLPMETKEDKIKKGIVIRELLDLPNSNYENLLSKYALSNKVKNVCVTNFSSFFEVFKKYETEVKKNCDGKACSILREEMKAFQLPSQIKDEFLKVSEIPVEKLTEKKFEMMNRNIRKKVMELVISPRLEIFYNYKKIVKLMKGEIVSNVKSSTGVLPIVFKLNFITLSREHNISNLHLLGYKLMNTFGQYAPFAFLHTGVTVQGLQFDWNDDSLVSIKNVKETVEKNAVLAFDVGKIEIEISQIETFFEKIARFVIDWNINKKYGLLGTSEVEKGSKANCQNFSVAFLTFVYKNYSKIFKNNCFKDGKFFFTKDVAKWLEEMKTKKQDEIQRKFYISDEKNFAENFGISSHDGKDHLIFYTSGELHQFLNKKFKGKLKDLFEKYPSKYYILKAFDRAFSLAGNHDNDKCIFNSGERIDE